MVEHVYVQILIQIHNIVKCQSKKKFVKQMMFSLISSYGLITVELDHNRKGPLWDSGTLKYMD